MLEEKIESSQDNSVEGDILELRRKLSAFIITKTYSTEDVQSRDDLQEKIDHTEMALASLVSIKDVELIGVNLKVHRIIAETGCLKSPLKEDVAKLYLLWEKVYDQNTANMTFLHGLLSKYDDYDSRSKEISAKINNLNEDLDDSLLNDAEQTANLRRELKELRRNVRRWFGREFFKSLKPELLILERKLFPDCEDDDNDSGIVQHSDEEDKMASLSSHRRSDVEAEVAEDDTFRDAIDGYNTIKQEDRKSVNGTSEEQAAQRPVEEPPSKKDSSSQPPSRIWRIFRASIPFQIAFALLCCFACALEPHCCDFFNSFSSSLMPQLRYMKGPPPV